MTLDISHTSYETLESLRDIAARYGIIYVCLCLAY